MRDMRDVNWSPLRMNFRDGLANEEFYEICAICALVKNGPQSLFQSRKIFKDFN